MLARARTIGLPAFKPSPSPGGRTNLCLTPVTGGASGWAAVSCEAVIAILIALRFSILKPKPWFLVSRATAPSLAEGVTFPKPATDRKEHGRMVARSNYCRATALNTAAALTLWLGTSACGFGIAWCKPASPDLVLTRSAGVSFDPPIRFPSGARVNQVLLTSGSNAKWQGCLYDVSNPLGIDETYSFYRRRYNRFHVMWDGELHHRVAGERAFEFRLLDRRTQKLLVLFKLIEHATSPRGYTDRQLRGEILVAFALPRQSPTRVGLSGTGVLPIDMPVPSGR